MSHPRFLWEVTIGPSNDQLEFDEGAAALTANLTAGDYYLRGGGAAGTDLLQHIAWAMTAAAGAANIYGVTVSSTGTVTIARIAGPNNFTLHWSTGPGDTRAIANILGYSTLADDGPGTSFPSDFQHRFGWYPEMHLLDGRRRFPTATAGAARSLGAQQWTQQWATDFRALARIDFVPRAKIRRVDVDGTVVGDTNESLTTDGNSLYEGFYDAARRGVRFEFYPNVAAIASGLMVIDPDESEWFTDFESAAELLMEAGERYRVLVPMRPFVS